jgi:hypothetical protein
MRYKKDFWIAIFLFICTFLIITSFIRNGFATYRLCGTILFPFLGIAFLRRALKS